MTIPYTALITGSTSGIGRSFTNLFAQKGYSLILVARNEEKLEKQAKELAESYDINVSTIRCDLEKENAADIVYQRVQKLGLPVHILINNAGFNECGSFLETDGKKETDMMHLHMFFTTQLMKLFLPQMIHNKYGRILNVGSTGSYIPCPYDAVYAATKAYILSLSKALSSEFKNTNISITTLCPGSTKTEFASKAGIENTLLFKLFVMHPDKVAKIGYNALIKKKTSVIAGTYNKLLVISSFLLPRPLTNFLTKQFLRQ